MWGGLSVDDGYGARLPIPVAARRRPLSFGMSRPSRSRPAKGTCAVNGCWSRCRQKADHIGRRPLTT
jgi:hypothetical protein